MFALFLSILFLYRVDAIIQKLEISKFASELIRTDFSDCLVKSIAINQPVYSNKAGGFVLPDKDGIRLQKGEELLLSCLGEHDLVQNKLEQSNSGITVAICHHDEEFLIEGKPYNFGKLECDQYNRGSVDKTTTACNGGVMWYIAYHIHDQFLRLIDICYDEKHKTTIYTKHTLFGGTVPKFKSPWSSKPSKSSKPFKRPWFRPEHERNVYDKPNQKKRLTSLLLSPESVGKYSTDEIFLSKGHLSPAGDFIFSSWRDTSYYFINVCPQWATINSGNWVKVENIVRELARGSEENLQVITGTHDVLEISDSNGSKKKFYLSDSGAEYPVPKFIWKIVYSEKSLLAIALVVQNDPYASKNEFSCKCICENNGWSRLKQTNQTLGLVRCCDYTSFKLSVSTVPDLRVGGVLQGPKPTLSSPNRRRTSKAPRKKNP